MEIILTKVIFRYNLELHYAFRDKVVSSLVRIRIDSSRKKREEKHEYQL